MNPRRILCLVADASLHSDQWRTRIGLPAGYEIRHFSSLHDLVGYANQTDELVTGFITELRLLLKASLEEKTYFAEMLDYFPIFRMKTTYDAAQGGITVTTSPGELQDYYSKVNALHPRGIRKAKRRKAQLHVRLCAEAKWDAAKSFTGITRDLSPTGAYVIDTAAKGTHATLLAKFAEFPEGEALRCRVVRHLAWGNPNGGYAGWALKFEAEREHPTLRWLHRMIGV